MGFARWKAKDPQAVKDYSIDWAARLLAGEAITTSTWAITPSGELDEESSSISGAVTVIWLSGGVAGQEYEVTNHIVTSRGMADDITMLIKVENR